MRSVIKVVAARAGEEPDKQEELVGLVPGSVKQATAIAEDYLAEHPATEVVIRRGAKVLRRLRNDPARSPEAA